MPHTEDISRPDKNNQGAAHPDGQESTQIYPNEEQFWDEDDSELLGFTSSRAFGSLGEAVDCEEGGDYGKFQRSSCEKFLDERKILPREQKKRVAIDGLKSGMTVREIEKYTRIARHTIRKYYLQYKRQNGPIICGCGKEISEHRLCSVRAKRVPALGGNGRRRRFEKHEIEKLVSWYRGGVSLERLSYHFNTSLNILKRELKSAGIKIRKHIPGRPTSDIPNVRGVSLEIYNTWHGMNSRCYYPPNIGYKYYGGRGITVCPQWRNSVRQFFADMGEKPDGKTLDRIDVNGNYEPTNCRWATPKEQAQNQRRRTWEKTIAA